jgi:hypothetical protein
MKPLRAVVVSFGVVVLLGAVAASGCGRQGNGKQASPATAATTSGSKLDQGPRAAARPVDQELAEQGGQLFKDKGCSACHAFGTRLSGPDLVGVTRRRTAQWMENQILHPEVMVKEDPISRELMGVYALQMPNQGLTPDQARSVIEYLKHRDHESSENATAAAADARKEGD